MISIQNPTHYEQFQTSQNKVTNMNIKQICKSLLFIPMWLALFPIFAQDITVRGTIMEAALNEPVIGATVIVEGNASYGTVTDINGNFILTSVPQDAIIIVSYVGYETLNIPINGRTEIIVTLKEDTELLDEVVVVGYGQQRRINLTGAVDQIDGSTFKDRPITNLSQGLQGMVPNLNITPADGRPTQSPALNVRGATSIGQGGESLVLIDGVEGDPALINPHDIESVTVLKDASAAAVYGARAAFGVILITTKRPTQDRTEVTYTANYSIKNPTYITDFVTDGYQWA